MKIARENLISGLVVIALGLVFLSQAFGLEQANATEGIHPMDYPKALTWLFIAVGCCIVLVPSHRRSDSDIPLFSARTAAVSGILVAYALLLDHMGFGVTSFFAACGIGYAMGWRKLPSLLLSSPSTPVARSCNRTFTLPVWLPCCSPCRKAKAGT